MVGIAQLVSAPDCGSGGPGFESQYPPFQSLLSDYSRDFFIRVVSANLQQIILILKITTSIRINIGLSPSGKAQDFDSCTRGFESR